MYINDKYQMNVFRTKHFFVLYKLGYDTKK